MNFLKKITLLLAIAICISSLQSCKKDASIKKDAAIEAIPPNATLVTAIDLPAIMEKADFKKVKQMEFYQFLIEKAREESDVLAAILANPENAGIDLSKKAYLSLELDSNNPEEMYGGLIVNLLNAEDFKALAKVVRGAKINQTNDYQMANFDQGTALAWNDRIGVIAFGEEIEETILHNFFVSKPDIKLADNENFRAALSQKHDINTWLTSSPLAKNTQAQMLLSMMKIKSDALKDNFVHGFIDFEEGQIIGKADYFFQQELVQDPALLFKDQVKTDFSAYMPAQNLNTYLSIALDLKGLDNVLSKRPQVRSFADFFLNTYHLSIKKLTDILDGDLVLATYTGNINNRQEGLLATKIKDQREFENLLALAEENELVIKTETGRYNISPRIGKVLSQMSYFSITNSNESQLILKDGIAFLSGNAALLDQIESGRLEATEQLPVNIKSLVNQHPLALFLDFNSLKRVGIPGVKNFDQLQFSSTGRGADFKLDMKEKKINSLYAIFKAINQEFLKDREQKQTVSEGKM